MLELSLALLLAGLAVGLPMTAIVRAVGHRLRAMDAAGVAGQVKAGVRAVPNTGGVAIFLGVAIPVLAGLAIVTLVPADQLTRLLPGLRPHLPGLRAETPNALILIGATLILHVTGLIDDRRPLGPRIKLAIMAVVSIGVVLAIDRTRLLTVLDGRVGGIWLSAIITAAWLIIVTNAFNFLDNMDGLSAGVAAISATFFLAATLINGQWFVAALLALLVGALLGFLYFNYPWRRGGATIFMGDSGSLVVGFLLGFLTVRTTYLDGALGGAWYGVFMPLVVLAVPIYDFISVTAIRISQGRSPFVGDLQHFSHRLVQRGLGRRAAVNVIYGLTAVTAIGGVSLARLHPWQAVLVGAQTILVLLVLAIFEYSSVPQQSPSADESPDEGAES